MSKSIRVNTLERILQARERDPLALGPYFGELATRQKISATILGEMVDTNAQTITRWMQGESEIQAYWMPRVAKALGFLAWRKLTNAKPLTGTPEQQRAQIEQDLLDFKASTKSSGRISPGAA